MDDERGLTQRAVGGSARAVADRGTWKAGSAKQGHASASELAPVRPHSTLGVRESAVRSLMTAVVLPNGTRVDARVVSLSYRGQPLPRRTAAMSADHAPVISRWIQFVHEVGWWGQDESGRRTSRPEATLTQLEMVADQVRVGDWMFPDSAGRLWRVDSIGRNAFYSSAGDHAPPAVGWGEIIYDAPTTQRGSPDRAFERANRPHRLVHQLLFEDYLFQNDVPVARLGWMQQESYRVRSPGARDPVLHRDAMYLSVTHPSVLPSGATLPSHLALAKRMYEGWVVRQAIPRYWRNRGEPVPADGGAATQQRLFGQP